MLIDAAFILIAAATLGALLAVVQLQRPAKPPIPWPVGIFHGLLGAAGFVLMLLAPAVPSAALAGAGSFRAIAAVFLALALLAGLFILRARLGRKRLSFGLVGAHALVAICGVVLLAGYLVAG